MFNKRSNRKSGLTSWCKWCLRETNKVYRDKNKVKLAEKRKVYDRIYLKNNKDLRNARNARHRATKLQATPKWSENEKIKVLYKKAKWLETLTGFRYQVDHIVPLNNTNVCGLHVWANLQILEEGVNFSKGNRYE
jgi:hypothetical protein